MSLFRIVKYSSILFFFGKYKTKIFRVLCVLAFALISSLLYQDVADYLSVQHPGAQVYALVIKVLIVYGALAFVLWQFRPEPESRTKEPGAGTATPKNRAEKATAKVATGPLHELEDVSSRDRLRSRYEGMLAQQRDKKP